jgi:hypothetical protein
VTGQQRPEDAAHRYAEAGWPVFPCLPGSKLPATEHGFLEATTGHRQISRWWSRQPDANVAIATGEPGPDVIDVDIKAGRSGFAALNEARRAGLAGGARAVVRTPSGGAHFYYRGTAQRNGAIPGRALDFRSGGGYVVAPPSRSADSGRRYEVITRQASDATVDWSAIRALVAPEPEHQPARQPAGHDRPRDVGHLAAWLAGQQEGNRNGALFWAATRACEAGDYAALAAIAKAARDTGLSDREITATVKSARRTAGRPFEPAPQREAG